MNKKLFATFLMGAVAVDITFSANQNQVDAAAVNGIVTTTGITRLYNNEGHLITNRALAANTPWLTNEESQIAGIGTAYQVATNEFVKASDVNFEHGHASNGVIRAGVNGALVYGFSNGEYTATSNKLEANSVWQYNYTDDFNGKTWYQVSNNAWINSDEASTSTAINNTGVATISYAPSTGADLWQGYGDKKVATGQKLANGSQWNFSQKVIDSNGDAWYQVGGNQWISGGYTKINNYSFDEAAAGTWDPNFAALRVTQNTSIYYDSKYSAVAQGQINAGTLVEVASTVQEGNTIWYELSNGGWLPSSVVTPINNNRSTIILNGKTREQAINDVISAAKQELGKPYIWNAKGPDGFDCSGLMQYVFRQATGQNIGSWTVPQETAGYKVSLNALEPGDLLFWGTPGASYHVALYLGNNEYLNALRPGTNVKIDPISSNFAPSFGVRVL